MRSTLMTTVLLLIPAVGVMAQEGSMQIEGAPAGAILAFANQGKPVEVAEASPSGTTSVAWDAINFGKPPDQRDQLTGQEVTAYECEDGRIVLVLQGEPVPEECDEDAVLAVLVWGQSAPVQLGSPGPAGAPRDAPSPGDPGTPGQGADRGRPDKVGRFGIGYESVFVRGGLGVNRLHEESLDGFCDAVPEPCNVTTSQVGIDLALEVRVALAQIVTAGLAAGWTDLDGAEIVAGEGPDRFQGFFRASALFAQLAFYFHGLEAYPWLHPYAVLGVTRWSAESGSSAGDRSSSQEDDGTGLLYGAGVAMTGLGPGQILFTVRRTGMHAEEGAEVDNSVTQLQVGYAIDMARLRAFVQGQF